MKLSPQIQAEYDTWRNFLYHNVTFSHKVSTIHTKGHCARVLLFAFCLAQILKLDKKDRDILGAAASFHDSRRHDDYLDVGHGQRAATYYRRYCQKTGLLFHRETYAAMAYHDRDDKLGNQVIGQWHDENALRLYHLFKDADALDRFRLGPRGLDVRYLRSNAAKSLYEFARAVDVKELGPGILTHGPADHFRKK